MWNYQCNRQIDIHHSAHTCFSNPAEADLHRLTLLRGMRTGWAGML